MIVIKNADSTGSRPVCIFYAQFSNLYFVRIIGRVDKVKYIEKNYKKRLNISIRYFGKFLLH